MVQLDEHKLRNENIPRNPVEDLQPKSAIGLNAMEYNHYMDFDGVKITEKRFGTV